MHLPIAGPAHAVNVFLAGEDRKEDEIFEMLACPGTCAQMQFRQKRRKDSFLLHWIEEKKCLIQSKVFFLYVFQLSDRNFLVFHFYGSVCSCIPKLI